MQAAACLPGVQPECGPQMWEKALGAQDFCDTTDECPTLRFLGLEKL